LPLEPPERREVGVLDLGMRLNVAIFVWGGESEASICLRRAVRPARPG